ncbi:MAG: hypothetical protein ABIO39_08865 [Caulobacteraceae bacterium]
MDLTPDQIEALRNLSRKQAGKDVDYINIASARVLIELGLALRNREGWIISPTGVRLLADMAHVEPEADIPSADILSMVPPGAKGPKTPK